MVKKVLLILVILTASFNLLGKEVRLFDDYGFQKTNYEELLKTIEKDDVLVFSDNKRFKYLGDLGSGQTTRAVRAIDSSGSVMALRLPKGVGYGKNLGAPYPEYINQFIKGSKKLQRGVLNIPKIFHSKKGQYVAVELINHKFSAEEFFFRSDLIPQDVLNKAKKAFKTFAKEVATLSMVSDFRAEQVVYDLTHNRWVVIDWLNGSSYVTAQESATSVTNLLDGSFTKDLYNRSLRRGPTSKFDLMTDYLHELQEIVSQEQLKIIERLKVAEATSLKNLEVDLKKAENTKEFIHAFKKNNLFLRKNNVITTGNFYDMKVAKLLDGSATRATLGSVDEIKQLEKSISWYYRRTEGFIEKAIDRVRTPEDFIKLMTPDSNLLVYSMGEYKRELSHVAFNHLDAFFNTTPKPTNKEVFRLLDNCVASSGDHIKLFEYAMGKGMITNAEEFINYTTYRAGTKGHFLEAVNKLLAGHLDFYVGLDGAEERLGTLLKEDKIDFRLKKKYAVAIKKKKLLSAANTCRNLVKSFLY